MTAATLTTAAADAGDGASTLDIGDGGDGDGPSGGDVFSFFLSLMNLTVSLSSPRPVPGAPARRLRRPSARRSDPMAIGKLVRSRLHKVSIL